MGVEECHNEEVEELCAPVNCRFVNLTIDCKEEKETTWVSLNRRECSMCKNECKTILTDNCDTDPLNKTWKKYCVKGKNALNETANNENLFRVIDELPRRQDTSAKRKILVETDETKKKLAYEKVNEILDKEQTILAEELSLIKRIKEIPTNLNLNIRYNTISGNRNHTPSTLSPKDPILHLIDTQIFDDENNFSNQVEKPVTKGENKPLIKNLSTTTTIRLKPNLEKKSKENKLWSERNILEKQKLSAADFLRLCFTSGVGCDFNKNFAEEEDLTTEPNTTPLSTTSQNTVYSTTENTNKNLNKLLERVRRCFFSRICNDSSEEISAAIPIIRQPRVISAATKSPPQREETKTRDDDIRSQIQARAKACFFHGQCS